MWILSTRRGSLRSCPAVLTNRKTCVQQLKLIPIVHTRRDIRYVWLVQKGLGVCRSDAGSLMCAGGPGSIPGADNLDSGFQPSGVDKMSSSQYVDGWPLQKTAKLKRAFVRWPRVAYAASGAHYHTCMVPSRLARVPWK